MLTRGIVEAIKVDMFHASLKAEMDPLEARKQELADALNRPRARGMRRGRRCAA